MNATMEGSGDADGLSELYETPKKKAGTIDDEERAEMNMSATVPVKVLQGKHPDAPKVGDEIVVKVKEINGDQAMIEYSETPASDIGEGEGYEKGYESSDDEIDRMSKEY